MSYFQPIQNDPFAGQEIHEQNCSDYLGPWIDIKKPPQKEISCIKQLKKVKNNRNIDLHIERFAARKLLKNPECFIQNLEAFD